MEVLGIAEWFLLAEDVSFLLDKRYCMPFSVERGFWIRTLWGFYAHPLAAAHTYTVQSFGEEYGAPHLCCSFVIRIHGVSFAAAKGYNLRSAFLFVLDKSMPSQLPKAPYHGCRVLVVFTVGVRKMGRADEAGSWGLLSGVSFESYFEIKMDALLTETMRASGWLSQPHRGLVQGKWCTWDPTPLSSSPGICLCIVYWGMWLFLKR